MCTCQILVSRDKLYNFISKDTYTFDRYTLIIRHVHYLLFYLDISKINFVGKPMGSFRSNCIQ